MFFPSLEVEGLEIFEWKSHMSVCKRGRIHAEGTDLNTSVGYILLWSVTCASAAVVHPSMTDW